MTEIYLDNAATTRVHGSCAAEAVRVMTEVYGNPSSTHSKGVQARDVLENARSAVASAVGAKSEEIFFTSGGTEANNLAVLGGAEAKKREGGRIVTTAIEHPSVLESVRTLERSGYETVFLRPDRQGRIFAQQLEEALTPDTILVSMMYVNNEVGSVMPVDRAAGIIRRKSPAALFHVDCVQAFGKLPVSVRALGCDMLSVSGHKIHAPKGVGALYIRKGVKLCPRTFGGSQQKGIRPGTEPLPSIAAFGAAAAEVLAAGDAASFFDGLNRLARRELSKIDKLVFNSPEDGAGCILNFSTCRVMSEVMLNYLSSKGIYVSNGSACKAGQKSHIIDALGMEPAAAKSVVRASFSRDTAAEEIEVFCREVKNACETLVNFK